MSLSHFAKVVAAFLLAWSILLAGCTTSELASEVDPYIKYLGGPASEDVKLPEDLYENADSVMFLGMEGTVSFAQSLGGYFLDEDTVDELTWELNDTVTHDEYDRFIAKCNQFFGHEAEEVEVLSDPCQRWNDEAADCMVTASYETGKIEIAWQLNSTK